MMQVSNRFRPIAGLNVIQGLATLTIIVAAYLLHGGLPLVVLAYIVGKTVGALGIARAALIEAGKRWGSGWHKAPLSLLRPQVRELLHFAVSTNLSASLNLINKDSELLWVALFRSPLEAGYYRLALSLINLVQMPISPLAQTTYPELSREVARGNWPAVRHVLRSGSIFAGGYTLIAAIVLLIFGRPMIQLLYGAEFLPAYPALMILMVGYLFANTFYWARTAMLALGNPGYPTRVNLLMAAGKLAGILLLTPIYGYLANAALLAASYIFGVTTLSLKVRSSIRRHEAEIPTQLPV